MKYIFQKIQQNWRFLLFILVFAYIQSIYTRISVRGKISPYIFTPESAMISLFEAGVLFFIILFFIKKWQKSNVPSAKTMLKIFGASLCSYLIFIQLLAFSVALVFNKIEQNYNLPTFTLSLFSDFLKAVIYGSFFISYYYYDSYKKHQQKLVMYNKALSESKINQLKTQLNPHFLFNNLNVLDQLIEEDKYKASDFLHEFAEIYRYVLYASDKELVSIQEELDFAEQYFRLIQHKYGNAYQLNIETKHKKGLIVPLTLQLLLENAIKHNLGTIESPIYIHLTVDGSIHVTNNVQTKRNTKPLSGRALKNLAEQYHILSKQPIEIYKSEKEFKVSFPIIDQALK